MRFKQLFLFLMLLATSGFSQSASVSFGLSENSIGLDTGIDYATVTISDSTTTAGDIDFQISINHDFFDELSKFGLQSFYFNSAVDTMLLLGSGPVGWSFMEDYGTNPIGTVSGEGFEASGFGSFNIKYAGMPNDRQDPLEFTLRTNGDSLSSYIIENSAGYAFAAYIADFSLADCCDNTQTESGWFSTSTTPSHVPVPTAFWLFGTALIGFIGFSRRIRI